MSERKPWFEQKCPKCGISSVGLSATYQNFRGTFAEQFFDGPPEYIQVKCQCGYWWSTPCADAQEKE